MGAVGPGALEDPLVPILTDLVESLQGQRRPQQVPTHALQPLSVCAWNQQSSVQIESAAFCVHPLAPANEPGSEAPLQRRERLGGLLNHYHRRAA